MVPDPLHLPTGCVFHPRCPAFMPGRCDKITPRWTKVGENQYVNCLLYEDGLQPDLAGKVNQPQAKAGA
jgi:peptide/nickel transport system ATP-binding protein